MSFEKFLEQNEYKIKSIAERLKDFKIKGFPLRFENAKQQIKCWLENFKNAGFHQYSLPLKLLESLEFLKTETLVQKVAELVEPLTLEPNTYLAPLGETSESSHRIVANFNQFENYFPNIETLLNNIPDNTYPNIILVDDFLNSGGQLINIFYALLGSELPDGEPNDEIDYRTKLNPDQIAKLKRSKIRLVFYLAFDEGIEKIINRCKKELCLDIEIKRYLATNKNESAFGDPFEQESIRENLRTNINSSSSAFTGWKTEELSEFYNFLYTVGIALNKVNKPEWDEAKVKNRALGYSNLGRLIVTDYNIPTISITAIWQNGQITINDKLSHWHSLVPRREKNLSNGNNIEEKEPVIEQLIANLRQDNFDASEEDLIPDEIELKGHSELYKILKLYRPNSKFSEILKYENRTKKIGYVIYQENDDVQKKVIYYLYLFQGVYLNGTYEDLKAKLPGIFKNERNLIVLLPKEKNQVQVFKRRENVQETFRSVSTFYIDDFIREKCTPSEYFQQSHSSFLNNKAFVTPTIKSEYYNEINLESIKSWINSENEPTLVLKGLGGVGKTTLAEYVSDLFILTKSHSKVIFIDSHEIIEELIRRERFNETIDLYHLYEVDTDMGKDESYKLTRDQFKLNLDSGNLLIVIDGLDEVISRIPKFDVEVFLDSILRFSDETGNGKVLISCRSFFWQSSKYSTEQITSIEVLPFNSLQAKRFFEKCFPKNQNNVKKAIDLANKLVIISDDGNKYYHPYVLDIIRNLIETDRTIYENDISVDSKLLAKNFKFDLIIYEVCNRESNRIIRGITIDEQVKIFMELAVDHKGIFKQVNLAQFILSTLQRHVDSATIEGLKSHPFFSTVGDSIKFRYDFFTQYFKSIYVAKYIKYNSDYEKVDKDFINILIEDCWYNSGTINDMKGRIESWEEDDNFKILDLLSQIKGDNDLEKDAVRKAISHLFYVALAINQKFRFNEINSNTNLLKSLFDTNGIIENLCLINFNSKKDNIRFDFRGVKFKDCYIDNFESFWICPGDLNTIFESCTLINLNFSEILKSPIPRENFRNCIFNEEIDEFYKHKKVFSGDNLNVQIKHYLLDFFKLFLSRGKIERQQFDSTILPFLNDNNFIIEKNEFLDFLNHKGVISLFDDYGVKYVKAQEQYKSDIKDFIRNGIMKNNLSTLIKEIKLRFNLKRL